MDPKDILKLYIDSCNDRSDYFQCNLASNSVLDWFGRTFKGSKKIEQYLRFDVWPQYEQNFTNAAVCDPIENKATHAQAKETPIENQQSCQAQSVNASEASGFESPPNSKRNLDQPPPLTRGKRFLKTVEETEPQTSISNDINIVESVKGYNLRSANDDTIDNKIANTNSLSTAGKKTQRITRKRQAYINEVNEAITKRTKAINSTSVISTPTKSSQLSIDTIYNQTESKGSCNKATQSSTECSTHKTYSELKYLESIGSIRTIRRVKHPGINKVPTSKTDVVTPFISPESQNGWDRKTKLKLSYRIGVLNSNDIQFALIIYEPLTMVSRRNLMEEFQQAALEEAAVAANKNVATTKQNSCTQNSVKIKPKNDKFSSLRRLRF